MIKGLNGGPGVVVSFGNTSLPYVNQNSSNSFQGIMRIMGSDIQYFDNGAWISISSSYASVELDGDTVELLNWARQERERSRVRESRIKNHPALQKAFDAIQKATDNFDLLEKFVEHDDDNSPTSAP